MFIKLLKIRFIINLRIIIIYRLKIIFSSNLTGEFKTHFDPRGIYSNTFPLAIINLNYTNHLFSLFYNIIKNTLPIFHHSLFLIYLKTHFTFLIISFSLFFISSINKKKKNNFCYSSFFNII